MLIYQQTKLAGLLDSDEGKASLLTFLEKRDLFHKLVGAIAGTPAGMEEIIKATVEEIAKP